MQQHPSAKIEQGDSGGGLYRELGEGKFELVGVLSNSGTEGVPTYAVNNALNFIRCLKNIIAPSVSKEEKRSTKPENKEVSETISEEVIKQIAELNAMINASPQLKSAGYKAQNLGEGRFQICSETGGCSAGLSFERAKIHIKALAVKRANFDSAIPAPLKNNSAVIRKVPDQAGRGYLIQNNDVGLLDAIIQRNRVAGIKTRVLYSHIGCLACPSVKNAFLLQARESQDPDVRYYVFQGSLPNKGAPNISAFDKSPIEQYPTQRIY